VLDQMLTHGRITAQEHQAALETPITLTKIRQQAPETSLTMYFVDHVVEQVQDWLVANRGLTRRAALDYIHSGGLTIHTTLDLTMQRAAQQAALDIFNQPEGILTRLRRAARADPNAEVVRLAQAADFTWVNEHGVQPQVSMLFMDPSSGAIRVWVGGRDMIARFGRNRVSEEQNQPGSAIKPLLVYGPALDLGQYTLASTIDDAPVIYPTGNPSAPFFVPRNFDVNRFWGHTSFRTGMARSYNVMAARLFHALGQSRALDWAEKMGLTFVRRAQDPVHNDENLSAALGGLTVGLTLEEMVAGFNVFNNRGVFVEPNSLLRITSRTGSILYEARPPEKAVVVNEQVAWLMTDLMRGTVEVRNGVTGTGNFGLRGATMGRYPGEVSGKTGTTTGNFDALFVGFTPLLSGGVWIGHDNTGTGTAQMRWIDAENRYVHTRTGENVALAPPAAGETPAQALQRVLAADRFARGGMPSTGANAVGSGFATAIFGRALSNYYAAIGTTNFPRFAMEWYEEHGVFGPPRRLGLVYRRFSRVSGKYPSALTPPDQIGYDWFVRGTEPRPENPCDLHVVVAICTESNALAGPYCPPASVTMQLRVRREPYAEVFDRAGNRLHPLDHNQQVPFEQCPIHRAPQGNGSNGSPPPPNGQ